MSGTSDTSAAAARAGVHGRPEVVEACGVFGFVAGPCDVVRTIRHGLVALQHRGQEAAGLAVRQHDGNLVVHKDLGLVRDVFRRLPAAFQDAVHSGAGDVGAAIGHVRYATAGGLDVCHSQPFRVATDAGPLALAHNGHITNAKALKALLEARGAALASTSDSELLAHLLAHADPTPGSLAASDPDTWCTIDKRVREFWLPRLGHLMMTAKGAMSLVILTADGLFALRDPLGLRPLQLGRRDGPDGRPEWFVASESCAFATAGARLVRDVAPGEILFIDHRSDRTTAPLSFHLQRPTEPAPKPAFCVFEYVYFARVDSTLEKRPVGAIRERFGRALAADAPAEADVVVGVPDSALPAARAYADALGLPCEDVFIRNHFAGRSFIEPTAELRETAVRLKFTLVDGRVAGRRVVLVDDSLVRGTTARALVVLLREAGATEVHLRIASAPVIHPCRMGVDMAVRDELIAAELDAAEIAAELGANSLKYLSRDAMMGAIHDYNREPDTMSGHCHACFSGVYPSDLGRT